MRRSVLLIGGAALGLVVAAALVACGGDGESKPTATGAAATAVATSNPEATATSAPTTPDPTETPLPASLGFGCPTKWQIYACPTAAGSVEGLTVPYPAGAGEFQIMCKDVGFYASGIENNVSMLYRGSLNTEIVAPVDGQVAAVRSAAAPHEYAKSITLNTDPFLVQIYFVGEPKVSDNATVARGDVLGVITGAFPTTGVPDSRLNGASMVVNLIGYDSRMVDASSADVWAGGAPSCYTP